MATADKRILLLDDDYESMQPLKTFLETVYGWQVDLTAQESVLQQLTATRYDLVCVDLMIHPVSLDADNQETKNIHFPNASWRQTGLEFLRRLRAGEFSPTAESVPCDVPVIILSAVASDLAQELEPVGANRVLYMEKPFDLEEMQGALARLLEN